MEHRKLRIALGAAVLLLGGAAGAQQRVTLDMDFPTAMNGAGDVVGVQLQRQKHDAALAAIQNTGRRSAAPLETPPGGESWPCGINDVGTIVGMASSAGAEPYAVTWEGADRKLRDLGAGPGSMAYGINAAGDIVGIASGRAVLWRSKSGHHIFLSDRESRAYAINNAGSIVGAIVDAKGVSQAALWTQEVNKGGIVYYPYTLINTGNDIESVARSMNDAGDVAGDVVGPDGVEPFIYRPGTGRVKVKFPWLDRDDRAVDVYTMGLNAGGDLLLAIHTRRRDGGTEARLQIVEHAVDPATQRFLEVRHHLAPVSRLALVHAELHRPPMLMNAASLLAGLQVDTQNGSSSAVLFNPREYVIQK